MSAVLPSPPPSVRMRPFRILTPYKAMLEEFNSIFAGPTDTVVCVGPLHPDGEMSENARRTFTYRGRAYFWDACTAIEGEHLVLWRVANIAPRKSPRKLAHWDTLEAGVAMIVTPSPDADAEEKAVSRATYMRDNGRGRFQPFYAEDGALWVAKLPDAP